MDKTDDKTTSSRSQSKSTVIKKINFDDKKKADSPKKELKKLPPTKLVRPTSPKKIVTPIKNGKPVTKPVIGKFVAKKDGNNPVKTEEKDEKEGDALDTKPGETEGDVDKKEEGEEKVVEGA